MDYQKLINQNPTSYGKHINSLNQEIEFFECPIEGGDAPVICVCHNLKLASYSTFYETDDMTADHKEYEPTFKDNKLLIGGFED
jgi:hypothetical protein